MKLLIIFLIRWRLGLKKYEGFRFTNQKSTAVYYFTRERLIKYWHGAHYFSGVSLNWLLSDECEIEKVREPLWNTQKIL